jgi:hypothetical protein
MSSGSKAVFGANLSMICSTAQLPQGSDSTSALGMREGVKIMWPLRNPSIPERSHPPTSEKKRSSTRE